jgi:site-specific recombinase XerD
MDFKEKHLPEPGKESDNNRGERFEMKGADYLQQFLFDCGLKNLSETTIKSYETVIGIFIRWTEKQGIPFDKLDKEGAKQYIKHLMEKGNSPFSIKGRQISLRIFFRRLIENELWKGSNPFEAIPIVKTPKKIKPILSPEEIKQFNKAPNKNTYVGARDRLLILLITETLMRISECLNLRLGDIDLRNKVLKVVGKGRKEAYISFGLELQKEIHLFLKQWRLNISDSGYLFCKHNGEKVAKNSIEQNFVKYGKKIGQRVYPHLLRHSVASILALSGIPAFVLQQKLRHTSLVITKEYIHLAEEKGLKEVMEKYSPLDVVLKK